MAGIDRSDTIRRPVDSTLSTRTAHRGGEGLLQPQPQADVIAQLRRSAPAIAVVVEQRNLGSAQKPLFEVLLSMNDQWVRAQSNRPFQPGTVLLVEATPDDQIRVLPKPEPAQLNRMMQASLNFWQAHTLPRVHATELPPLPDPQSRQQLANDQPALRPLLDWLSQKPVLNARNLAAWVREFMPLTPPGRQPSLPPPNSAAEPLPVRIGLGNNAAAQWPLIGASGTPQAPPTAPSQAANAPAATTSQSTTGVPQTTQTTTAERSWPSPLRELVALIRALQPPPHQPVRLLAVSTANNGQWQLSPAPTAPPLTPVTTANRPVPITVSAVLTPPATTGQAPAPPTVPGSGAATTSQPQTLSLIRLIDVSQLPTIQRPVLSTPTLPEPNLASAPAALRPNPPSSLAVSALPLVATPDSPPPAQTEPWQRLPASTGQTDRLPLEMRLAQWLLLIDARIRQHPASLQQSLAQRAAQMLQAGDTHYGLDKPPPAPPLPRVQGGGVNPASAQANNELQPLLQLRNWLEAVQGKTQNNAIQQTLSALAQGGGDGQTVQQLSIPLVWMGPAAWANLEWWQESADQEGEDARAGGKRLWRFRLFFELEPLAPLCADLVWEPQQTDLTFWSEDRNTLAFLNRHLDTLESWTEGLGERELHTRHGMPRKKSTPEPEAFKPLVDIRT